MDVNKIHDVSEVLIVARKMEKDSAEDYNIWANECAANADSTSKKVFGSLVDDEERHIDQYDIELANIEKFGERYLDLQSIELSKGMAGRDVADWNTPA